MASKGYPPTFFIIGTDQHIGKTVTSMGFISKLLSPEMGYRPEDIGYIKPVGQQVRAARDEHGEVFDVDKDVALIAELYGLDQRQYRAMSPVVWREDSSTKFIDAASAGTLGDQRRLLLRRVREAYEQVAEGRKVVVAEGTGQPGVGSVAGVSNGDIITLLRKMGVPVLCILVARGGIGSTIDRIFPHLLSLNCMDCDVDGLIINAVRMNKFEKVCDYLQRYYRDAFPQLYCRFEKVHPPPPILGIIPEVPELGFPSMRLLAETFDKELIDRMGFLTPSPDIDYAEFLVRGVKVLSLESGFDAYLEECDLVVVGINANKTIQRVLEADARHRAAGRRGLSGMILSCAGTGGLSLVTLNAILNSEIPTLAVPQDSAEIVRRIAMLPVKIQPYDLAKKAYVDQVYRNYLDLSWVRETLDTHRPPDRQWMSACTVPNIGGC